MSVPRPPDPAKLVIGVFLKEKPLIESVAQVLADRFGPIDLTSPWLPFDYTDYYAPEMGGPLFRRLFAFEPLIAQRMLPEIKRDTNAMESRFARNGRRRVNIDPGYMLQAQFVLATGKNYAHRIFIGEGIYADLTLIYRKGRFETLPWTYPDYAGQPMHGVLNEIRETYMADLKRLAGSKDRRPDRP